MQPDGADQPELHMPNDQAEIPDQEDEPFDIFAFASKINTFLTGQRILWIPAAFHQPDAPQPDFPDPQ